MSVSDDKKRASGIELLRVLGMLLIVIGHIPHFYAVTPTVGGFGTALLANGGRLAVNLFLLVGAWFMVDAEFRAVRVLKLYFMVLGYAIVLTAVAAAAGFLPSTRETVRCFLPLLGRPLWFVSAYMTLLLLSPFLAMVGRLSVAALGRLVVLLAICGCMVCSLPDPQLTYFGDVVWFVMVYLFMLWFKRKSSLSVLSKLRWLLLFAGLLGYGSLVAVEIFVPGVFGHWADQFLFDFKTLPNFLISFCVFIFFLTADIGTIPWINAVARTSLAVYVVHQMPSFIVMLWGVIIPVNRLADSGFPAVWLVLTAGGVYVMASMLEVIRLRLVEPMFVRTRFFIWLCNRLEKFYAPLI